MENYPLIFNGQRDSATFYCATVNATAMKENDVVTLTGNGEVGYGAAAGGRIKGIVGAIESRQVRSDEDEKLCNVDWGRLFEGIALTGTTDNRPTAAGNYVVCDGAGCLMAEPTTTSHHNAFVLNIDTTNKVADIQVI